MIYYDDFVTKQMNNIGIEYQIEGFKIGENVIESLVNTRWRKRHSQASKVVENDTFDVVGNLFASGMTVDEKLVLYFESGSNRVYIVKRTDVSSVLSISSDVPHEIFFFERSGSWVCALDWDRDGFLFEKSGVTLFKRHT